jgi:hypothetical protein
MNEAQGSAGRRVAGWLARVAVRAWPEETRKWGLALEAELCEIEGPRASLRWALGGLMLLTRAWWNHLMRSWMLPAGVPEGGPLAALAKNAARVPRTPRYVTAVFLLASFATLMNADVRDGIKATFHAWSGYGWWAPPDDQGTVARLRQLGEQNHDAQAIAVVALLGENHTERIQMADKAVALDSSLTWIYAYVHTRDGLGACCNNPMPAEWLDKLQKWDPDNIAPHLLAAHESLLRFEEEWQKNGYRGVYQEEAKKYLQHDQAWLTAMDTAFHAQKYDGYFSRPFDLYRTVARRYGIRDMDTTAKILLSTELGGNRSEDSSVYAELLTDRAFAQERAGNYKAAEVLYRQPAQFSEGMALQSHTQTERENWERIEGDALRKMQPMLVKTGRADQAALLGFKLDALQTNRIAWGPVRPWSWNENGWEGLMIRLLTIAILVLGALSLASLVIVFLRRRVAVESRGRGMALASVGVDFCPLLLLLSVVGLFVAYRPISIMYDQYMTWPYPVYDFAGLRHALYTPYEMPDGAWGLFYDYLNPVHYWMAAIVGLAILVMYILFRRTLRRREIAS